MQIEKLIDLYKRNNFSEAKIKEATDFIEYINSLLEKDIDDFDMADYDKIIEILVSKNQNTEDNFVIMLRYTKVIDHNDEFIHLTKYTGMLDVFDNFIKRMNSYLGKDKTEELLSNYEIPYLGVKPKDLPRYTRDFMVILESNLDSEMVIKIITGNNHNLSEKSVLPEKIEYENSSSLEKYLQERHMRKVKELDEYAKTGKVWYEQTITDEVVDYVRSNQEILSAVLKDNALYITKIPYMPDEYLKTTDPKLKKYYGCHCPFARESVLDDKLNISEKFCYCSAGFAKFPFEVILGQKLPIECLETILGDSEICRFKIDLSGINYKK